MLNIYTIYENPSDFPGKFVVRRHLIRSAIPEVDPQPLAVTHDLATARLAIPPDLINVGRSMDDDPVIVESWM